MLVSVVISTYKRPAKLARCIESLQSSASRLFELLLYVKKNDIETISHPCLSKAYKVVIGDPLNGYLSLSSFYSDLCNLATGDYVWLMYDDCVVSGDWCAEIERNRGYYIYQPQTNRYGRSTYVEDMNAPFPIIPNRSWGNRAFDWGPMIDKGLLEHLRSQGLQTLFMHGVQVWHDQEAAHQHAL